MFSLLGCSAPKTPSAPSADGISVKDIPYDVPQFRREYKATISQSVTMTITAHSYSHSRMFNGELDQSDGKWVLFDPEKPADKILDRELLPTIERLCGQILALDHTFMQNPPREFIDENGVTWRRN